MKTAGTRRRFLGLSGLFAGRSHTTADRSHHAAARATQPTLATARQPVQPGPVATFLQGHPNGPDDRAVARSTAILFHEIGKYIAETGIDQYALDPIGHYAGAGHAQVGDVVAAKNRVARLTPQDRENPNMAGGIEVWEADAAAARAVLDRAAVAALEQMGIVDAKGKAVLPGIAKKFVDTVYQAAQSECDRAGGQPQQGLTTFIRENAARWGAESVLGRHAKAEIASAISREHRPGIDPPDRKEATVFLAARAEIVERMVSAEKAAPGLGD